MEAPKVKRLPAGELKTGQTVWQAGMVMQFSHWLGDVPVFTHFQPTGKGATQVNYVNNNLNRQSMIELAIEKSC